MNNNFPARIYSPAIWVAGLAAFAALYALSRYNYLLCHSFMELFAVGIALSVFTVGWNTRKIVSDTRFFMLAAACLSIGILDTVHVLTYSGMGVFPDRGSNLPTQLWIAARYVESLSFMGAALLARTRRQLNEGMILAGYLILTAVLLVLTIPLGLFPAMYTEGLGLTSAKVASEYIICAILAVAGWLFWVQREQSSRVHLQFLLAAIAATIASEISFTLYTDVYGFFNFLGHFFKLLSFWCIYKALVAGLLKDPFNTVFRELVQSRDKLQESESSLNAVFEQTIQLMGVVSLDGTLLRVNRAALEMTGAGEKDVVGKPFRDCPWWNHSSDLQEKLSQGIENAKQGSTVRFEAIHKSPNGDEHVVDFSISPIYDENDRLRCLLAESRDITEDKQKENQLREAYNKLNKLISLNLDGIIVVDKEGVILFINQAGAKMLGRSRDELIGMEFGRHISGEETAEIKVLSPRGSPGIADINVTETQWDGKPSYLLSLRDVTERRQAEEALRESEEKYRTVLKDMEEGYFEVDLAGNYTFYNEAMCKILGHPKEELMGTNYKRYMSGQTAKKVFEHYNRVYRTGISYKALDVELIRKDGSVCYVDTSVNLRKDADGRPIGFKGVTRDVTERKQAEQERENLQAQLRQAQKMEAIGTLAGGIAHDFNNILSSVLGYTELSLDEAEKDSTLYHNLSQVLSAGNRAKDLVRQILTLSRQEEQEFRPTPVTALAEEAVKMLRSTIPASIELRENMSGDQLIVNADPTQLHQVIVNLAINAGHAVKEEGGVVEVGVEQVGFDETIRKKYSDLGPGNYARITVSDNGVGISEQYIDKIFEPYFTTKEKGTGTGLGLSIVHSIIKNHSGHITVYSRPGQGTTFNVYLPLARREEEKPSAQSAKQVPGGTESVLLVDDEQPIVEIQQMILEGLGYRVAARTSSVEALEAFRSNPDKFDIVVTDMVMPNMNGDRLARKLKEIRPDIPVILCTGFSRKPDVSRDNQVIESVLMKPVGKAEIAKTLRNLLDKARLQPQTESR